MLVEQKSRTLLEVWSFTIATKGHVVILVRSLQVDGRWRKLRCAVPWFRLSHLDVGL